MGAIASPITSLTIVYSTVYSDADQRKHRSSASLAFVRGIHRGPVNSPHKWPVTRKMVPVDDVIMNNERMLHITNNHWLLGQSCDCPIASDVTRKIMGKWNNDTLSLFLIMTGLMNWYFLKPLERIKVIEELFSSDTFKSGDTVI